MRYHRVEEGETPRREREEVGGTEGRRDGGMDVRMDAASASRNAEISDFGKEGIGGLILGCSLGSRIH